MALEKSTKPSCASLGNLDFTSRLPDLELPEEPDFRSFPALLTMDEFIKRNRQLRHMFPDGLPTLEERWAAKSGDIFEF